MERNTSVVEAFQHADDILRQGVQGITDLITVPGLINLDFADVRTIVKDAGTALLGIGVAGGENRAQAAADMAIHSPLLETSIDGARGLLLNITGGSDLTLYEVNEAAGVISEAADDDANIIFGAVVDERLEGKISITVVATGFGERQARSARDAPTKRRLSGRRASERRDGSRDAVRSRAVVRRRRTSRSRPSSTSPRSRAAAMTQTRGDGDAR